MLPCTKHSYLSPCDFLKMETLPRVRRTGTMPKLPIFWYWTPKIIPYQQKRVHFQKSIRFYIIRFVFPLPFQVRISNCSTVLQKLAKICTAKRKGISKTKTRFFFFRIWIRSNIFCNFLGCRCPIFYIFLNIYICLCISFPMPYSKLFFWKISRSYGENSAPLPSLLPLHLCNCTVWLIRRKNKFLLGAA